MTSNYWWHQLFGKSGFCGHQKRSCRNIGGRHSCPVGLGKCGVEVENPKAGMHTNNSWKKMCCILCTQKISGKKRVAFLQLILIVKKNMCRYRYTFFFWKKKSTIFGTQKISEIKGVPILVLILIVKKKVYRF
jgi:hypothetical protein